MSDGPNHAVSFIYLVGCLILVLSAFSVRHIPIGQTVKMLLAWLLIFLAAFVAFTVKEDFLALGKRVLQGARGEPEMVQAGRELRVRLSEDGHFWVTARLNGEPVRFLVDSGATTTSISAETARKAGIEPGGLPAMVQTANGMVQVRSGRAGKLQVGEIERRNLQVHISEAFGPMDVLGMNFLSSLSGWGVEGQWLVLKP